MKETALINQARDALMKCLQEVPFVQVEVIKESKGLETEPDLLLRVKTRAGKSTVMVDVKTVGQPRVVREATNQLARFKEQLPDAYGVVMAPYISPRAAEICRQEGFGFADLAGNCVLAFDQVFISKEGKENPFARKRDLRSLYSPKAECVLRVLLSGPGRWWKAQSLAQEASVSLGQGFNVKKLLVDREWVQAGNTGTPQAVHVGHAEAMEAEVRHLDLDEELLPSPGRLEREFHGEFLLGLGQLFEKRPERGRHRNRKRTVLAPFGEVSMSCDGPHPGPRQIETF